MLVENLILAIYGLLPLLCLAAIQRFIIRQRAYLAARHKALRLFACNLLVLLMVCGVVLFLGEVYYRFIHDTTESYGAARTTREWTERYVQINESGFRDSLAVYSNKQEPGRRRVTILGDSFAFGHGVANVEDRFANLVRRARPDWQVHVYAEPGVETSGHLAYIRKARRTGYELDVVLLAYCLNDIADLSEPWRDSIRAAMKAPKPPLIVNRSYIINTWYHRLRHARHPFLKDYYGFVLDAYQSPLWETQLERLVALKNNIDAGGGQLVVVTFPFLHALGPAYEYRSVHEKLNLFWQAGGVPHLDLLRVYEPYAPDQLVVNAHDAHPNEFAHQLAADAIIALLDQLMASPQP